MLRALLPIALVAGIAGVAGGCYAEDGYTTATDGYGYSYGYDTPALSDVGPGVQVVTDYDYPVFFADGFYWRWYGGTWYSSPYWNRGWVVGRNVPYGVRGIERPWAYAHYRPGFRGPAYGRGYGPAYHGGPAYRGGPAYHGGQAYRGPIGGGHAAGGHATGGHGGGGGHH